MPHYKCVPCKARVQNTGKLGDPAGDLCPECGGPLEPVGQLAEVFGFRRVTASRSSTYVRPTAHQAAVAPPTRPRS